jgi:hypothetical protein
MNSAFDFTQRPRYRAASIHTGGFLLNDLLTLDGRPVFIPRDHDSRSQEQ